MYSLGLDGLIDDCWHLHLYREVKVFENLIHLSINVPIFFNTFKNE